MHLPVEDTHQQTAPKTLLGSAEIRQCLCLAQEKSFEDYLPWSHLLIYQGRNTFFSYPPLTPRTPPPPCPPSPSEEPEDLLTFQNEGLSISGIKGNNGPTS